MKLYVAFFLLAAVVLAVQAKALGDDKEQEHGKRVVRDLFSFEDNSASDELERAFWKQYLAQQAQNGQGQGPSQGSQGNAAGLDQGRRVRRSLADLDAEQDKNEAQNKQGYFYPGMIF
jgi:hypothetical protein